MKLNRPALDRHAATWVVGVLYGLFLVAPIGFFLFGKAGLKSLSVDRYVASDLARTVGFTVFQASLSSIASVLLALPGAYLVSHVRFPLRRFVQSVSLVPFVLPSIIVIICMISFYGNSGVLSRLLNLKIRLIYNFSGILIAHVFYNYAIALRIIGEGWSRISPRYSETAMSLGDSKAGIFFRITLRLLRPTILSALILIFIYCFMSFGIVLVFGGIRFSTLEVRAYQEMFIKLNYGNAALFAVVQLLISVFFFYLVSRFITKGQAARRNTSPISLVKFQALSAQARITTSIYWVFVGVFLIGPLISMIMRSVVSGGELSGLAYRSLFVPGSSSRDVRALIRSDVPTVIFTSVGIALASGSITFVSAFGLSLALKGRRNNTLRSFVMLPMAISMVTLSIGLRVFYGNVLSFKVLVIIGQFFLAFPLVFRLTDNVVGSMNVSIIETARSLGAAGFNLIRTVYFPILRRGLANAYAFAVAITFADFTIVINVGRGQIATFPVAIYRLIGFRSFDLALALSSMYIVICLGLFLIIDYSSMGKGEIIEGLITNG